VKGKRRKVTSSFVTPRAWTLEIKIRTFHQRASFKKEEKRSEKVTRDLEDVKEEAGLCLGREKEVTTPPGSCDASEGFESSERARRARLTSEREEG